MSTAADRRAACGVAARLITRGLGRVRSAAVHAELLRIRDAMRAASEVVDGEGVENASQAAEVASGTTNDEDCDHER